MADQLYLNLWFPSFQTVEMLPRMHSVLRQFPASESQPGIGYVAVHSVSWNEPMVFEQEFEFNADADHAIQLANESLHADNAFEFVAAWDLWVPVTEGELDQKWALAPQPVRFFAYGKEFDEGSYQEDGHIQVDFGLDTPFLHEDLDLDPAVASRIKQNVQKLVLFTQSVEKNCGIAGRVLWSESDENLAQKLIAKLQKVQ